MLRSEFRCLLRIASALAISAAMTGAAIAQTASPVPVAEHYLVVNFDGLGRYWHYMVPPAKLPSRNVLERHPSGCAAISVRIEPDGTPHQMQVLKSEWTPMLPVYKQMMNAQMIDQVKRALQAESTEPAARPGLQLHRHILHHHPATSIHPAASTQKKVNELGKEISALCRVPDFIDRVARATDMLLPRGD